MNPNETEILGLALNLIEALNIFNFSYTKRNYKKYRKTWCYLKIQHVIDLMDEVLV